MLEQPASECVSRLVEGNDTPLVRIDGQSLLLHACDDEPAPPQDVIEYAAEIMGADVPPDIPFEEAGLSDMAKRFYAECKRVSNARTKSLTGWRPIYADYREGLQAIWSARA